MTAGGADGALPRAATLVEEMRGAVAGVPPTGTPALGWLVAELTSVNLRQWDLEDTTRDLEASDAAIARAKRAIDEHNLIRHRLVHDIDVAIADLVDPPATAALATESPGMVLDRLSVLVIRRDRTVAASTRDPAYAARLPDLDGQLGALVTALDGYLNELRAGARRYSAHEPLKLYLGPSGGRRGDGSHHG